MHPPVSTRTLALAAVAALGLSGGTLATAAGAAAAPTAGSAYTMTTLTHVGAVTLSRLQAAGSTSAGAAAAAAARNAVARNLARHPATGAAGSAMPPVVSPTAVTSKAPGLRHSWQGVNAYTETVAEGFTFTPPDQGLCAGGGYVLEIVNNALQVYTAGGGAASPVVSTNPFFDVPPVYNPKTGRWGAEPTDPTCVFDPATGRFFAQEVVLALNPKTGGLTLANFEYLSVSRTADPRGTWDVYRMNLTDTHAGGMHVNCPCLGDFPKLAVDANGVYLTTNEYPWSGAGFYGNGFNGAQLYAAGKQMLVHRASQVPVLHFSDTSIGMSGGGRQVGFTLWPAAVPGGAYPSAANGTEYFLSSTAAAESQPKNFTGASNTIGVYALTDTASLNTAHPHPMLSGALLRTELYAEAPYAQQRPGPIPLRDCLAVACRPGIGPSSAVEGGLDPSDTRPLTAWYANGRLFMALDTVMRVKGNLQSGPAWFAVDPSTSPSAARLTGQGYVGLFAGNAIYPSIATAPNGMGVMDVTLAGRTMFPTQGYLRFGPTGPTGPVSVTVPGAAPLDDFCEYAFFNCAGTSTPTARPRYGDYSWAAYMNGSVYVASEDVSSRCSFAQFNNDPTCGGTRAPLSNWSTRISAVTP